MKAEKYFEEIRYTLSNDNLKVGDKVYPIVNGRCLDNGGWIIHDFDYREFCSGFPDDPHTILDLHYSDTKSHEVRTDFGFSPIECYYKIIKREHQVKECGTSFSFPKWMEIY